MNWMGDSRWQFISILVAVMAIFISIAPKGWQITLLTITSIIFIAAIMLIAKPFSNLKKSIGVNSNPTQRTTQINSENIGCLASIAVLSSIFLLLGLSETIQIIFQENPVLYAYEVNADRIMYFGSLTIGIIGILIYSIGISRTILLAIFVSIQCFTAIAGIASLIQIFININKDKVFLHIILTLILLITTWLLSKLKLDVRKSINTNYSHQTQMLSQNYNCIT